MAIVNISKPQPTAREWSQYQEAVFKEIKEGTGNLLVEAVAGSGKTTTILHALNLVPADKKTIFLAFNKGIADNLADRVPYHVEAKTLHSLGYSIMKKSFKHVVSNGKKNRNILWYEILDTDGVATDREWAIENGSSILDLVSRLKSLGLQPKDVAPSDLSTYAERFDIDLPDDSRAQQIAYELFRRSWLFTGEKGNCVMDFDDMICMPAMFDLPFPSYDYVFIDECQDLNEVQKIFVGKLLAAGGRLVAVGDTHQAIYAFMGADSQSMSRMQARFACKCLPLSISYRCPLSIILRARNLVPHIEARPGAEDGIVDTLPQGLHYGVYEKRDVHVLARVNSVLVSEALSVARLGYSICILGNDLTPQLMKYAKQVASRTGYVTRSNINLTCGETLDGIPEKMATKRARIQDMFDTLSAICGEGLHTPAQMKARMEGLFFDKRPATPHVCFSTVHKAKGLEAETVVILRPDLFPHPLAGPEGYQQEMNLLYVAITRSTKELYFINNEEEDDGE